ncbi:helix-turn-helix domain-containing protein [uncultured Hydrogenophaga sp.]|uniref:helix-turn-helix domain-containing protein n=1 Tax=uncultured Hydrogenophaga sp. TaxID=199683 RepID=UPI00258BA4EA|nr:helix-turn-helix domain-containing protein [uncultured Hydrogenophaga sp.]
MATFADSLKKEIARLARKELKRDLDSLRKTAAAHRGEIAALKRDLKGLTAENKALAKQANAYSSRVSPTDMADADARVKPGRKVLYTAERFAATRAKLGLTQAQMAKLLGVSALSVFKWEKGGVEPRQRQKEKILALRSVGKRDAAKMLASSE